MGCTLFTALAPPEPVLLVPPPQPARIETPARSLSALREVTAPPPARRPPAGRPGGRRARGSRARDRPSRRRAGPYERRVGGAHAQRTGRRARTPGSTRPGAA